MTPAHWLRRISTRRVAIAAVALTAAAAWLAWQVESGGLQRELTRRKYQIAHLFSPRSESIRALPAVIHVPGILAGSGVASEGGHGDSTIIVVRTSNALAVARLVEYSARLVAYYSLPVRLHVAREGDGGAAEVGERTGLRGAGEFYVAITRGDTIAFRTTTLPTLDDHRELLGTLHARADRLRPVVPTTTAYWDSTVRHSRFAHAGETLPGTALLQRVRAIAVLEADCSGCRIEDHLRRIRRAGFDTSSTTAIVAAAQYLRTVRDSLPRSRVYSVVGRPSLAPTLGLITRETAIADPVVLELDRGAVATVRRLARIARTTVAGVQ